MRGERLTLYLDRFGTNEPVTDAKVPATLGGEGEIAAEPGPDGTYVASGTNIG